VIQAKPLSRGGAPSGGEVRPPLMVEVPTLTMGVGPSAEAQATMKDAVPKGPLAQMSFAAVDGS
jgi:hypothetical protein